MTKTKREWVEWFNSLDDDVEINLCLSFGTHAVNEKIKNVTIGI